MRKNFYLSGLFLCMLALCVGGCGDSAADPMGTATVQFIDGSGAIITTASVVPNGTITLIAQVTNLRSDGTAKPVSGEQVSFSLVNTGNGASLTVVNNRTGSGGRVTALFTSGNSMYSDIVRVTTDGSGSTATIHINKTGGMTDPRIKTLTASNVEVVAGQSSEITAEVVDGAGSPVMGVLVRFSIPVNGSGAGFANAYADGNFYAYTDVGGFATAVYQAGGVDPYNDVYDSVLAELENGSSNAVDIKRTAGTAPTPPTPSSYSITIGPASPTVPLAGGSCIITANVKDGTTNAGNVTVNFTTSGGSVSPSSRATGGDGNAATTFTTGVVGFAGNTAGVVTATITVDGNVYAASVVVAYK